MTEEDEIRATISALTAPWQEPDMSLLGMQVQSRILEGATRYSVCRARQVPSAARLLDVAVVLKAQAGAKRGIAILEPPAPERKSKHASDYLRTYQAIVWRAFGIAFVLGNAPTFEPKPLPAFEDPELESLRTMIGEQLTADADLGNQSTFWIVPEDSREAEAQVRTSVDRVLRQLGYQRRVDTEDLTALGKSYAGFWRRAEADGVWTHLETKRHIAIEVKLTEDAANPLCQVVDHLAHVLSAGDSGAVFNIRVHAGAKRGKAKPVDPALQTALKELETLPVRYLDVTIRRASA